ncbi:MAG TPA: MBL fold metallo-hydrolase, partial [Cytophagales bacterium]|nr:MBL fold metallo-hydrolase [Cytophagales bacterium]
FQAYCWAGAGHRVSRILKQGDQVGGFTVLETPGHSKGHLSFFREKDGVLIVGDVLVHMNLITTAVGLGLPPGLFTTDQELNKASVRKLLDLKPKILCFGHGPVLANKGQLQQFASKI